MNKFICGVGYNSVGDHQNRRGGRYTKAYQVWLAMLNRCYDKKTQKRQPTYIGCTVDDRWHDFQDFADWFYSHPYSDMGYQLDKDILVVNNKVYGPDTCCFVPRQLNNLLTNNAAKRGDYPQGVSFYKPKSKYTANISINSKPVCLGYFDYPQEARQAYVVRKEAYVKEKALEWRDRIADDVFQVLMSWKSER